MIVLKMVLRIEVEDSDDNSDGGVDDRGLRIEVEDEGWR
jgi:hypothetical protein